MAMVHCERKSLPLRINFDGFGKSYYGNDCVSMHLNKENMYVFKYMFTQVRLCVCIHTYSVCLELQQVLL